MWRRKLDYFPRILVAVVAKHRLSDNVGRVKDYLSTLRHALVKERHFALVEDFAFPTKARS